MVTLTIKLWRPDGLRGGCMYYHDLKQQREFVPSLPPHREIFLPDCCWALRVCTGQSPPSVSFYVSSIRLNADINSKKKNCLRNAVKFFKCFRTTKPLLFHWFIICQHLRSSSNMKFMLSRAMKSL